MRIGVSGDAEADSEVATLRSTSEAPPGGDPQSGRGSGQAPLSGTNRGFGKTTLRFPVIILNDHWLDDEAECILMSTCTVESTLMPAPRSTILEEAVTPWYHCISRCVRRAFLCGQGFEYRKEWIENRLKELVGVFAVEPAGFAVMDNHLHLLVRLDSKQAQEWSVGEVVRRWLSIFPRRDTAGKALPVSRARVELLAQDAGWVAKVRQRLGDLSWFMKCLKEPLARLANRADGCSGAFWEGRFKSINDPKYG